MDKGVKIIVGIKKVNAGEKGIYTSIYYEEPFDVYESEKADLTLGMKVGEEFTKKDFPDLKPGMHVKFYYEKGYKDMAVLDDIKIIKQ